MPLFFIFYVVKHVFRVFFRKFSYFFWHILRHLLYLHQRFRHASAGQKFALAGLDWKPYIEV